MGDYAEDLILGSIEMGDLNETDINEDLIFTRKPNLKLFKVSIVNRKTNKYEWTGRVEAKSNKSALYVFRTKYSDIRSKYLDKRSEYCVAIQQVKRY